MADGEAIPADRTSARMTRLNASLVAFGCLGLLGLAVYLTPDPRGLGTHEQLGLPPCISSSVLGVPCPLCGMTTAFTLMAHMRPTEAFQAQPAGAIFFVLCVCALAGSVTTVILGHTPRHIAVFVQSRWLGAVIVTLLAGAWIYKLVAHWL